MNYWKAATIGLAIVLLGLVYSWHVVMAQRIQKAHITTVGGQRISPTSHLPYIVSLDEVDLPPGQIKGFSCLQAIGKDYNGKDVAVPQCYILTQ